MLEDNIHVRVVPVETAGCYVPGGLYGYTMAAVMTAGVARAAGVKTAERKKCNKKITKKIGQKYNLHRAD